MRDLVCIGDEFKKKFKLVAKKKLHYLCKNSEKLAAH